MKYKSDKLILVAGHQSYAAPFEEIGTITKDWEDLTGADLVVFTGGHDVNPALYGELPHNTTHFNVDRDISDQKLFEKALFYRIPMVGICRGFQFLTVMNGGKLIQHIGDGHPYPDHNIITDDAEVIRTNTLHHQAAIADETIMQVLAISYPDSVVEAAYFPRTRCFGVQYHPEMMHPESRGNTWFVDKVVHYFFTQANKQEANAHEYH